MIEFKVDETAVVLDVHACYPLSTTFWSLRLECASKSYAFLLRENLYRNMTNKLEAIRKEAYNQGWKDAKAKTRKRDWFRSLW